MTCYLLARRSLALECGFLDDGRQPLVGLRHIFVQLLGLSDEDTRLGFVVQDIEEVLDCQSV